MITENATPENRATLFGIMNVTWPISGIVAPFLSGYIVENHGWAWIFRITSVVMAISFIPTLKLKEVATKIRPQVSSIRASILERRYIPFMALIFLFHFGMGTVEGILGTILPLYLKNQILLSESLIGLFFTASSILILFTQIPSGRLADSHGRKKIIVLSLLPVPIFYSLWLFIDNWVILLILFTATNGFRSMIWPPSVALVTDHIPTELIGSALGIRMTGMSLGNTLGPLMGGILYSQVDYKMPFLASAILVAMSIMVGLRFKEKKDRSILKKTASLDVEEENGPCVP